MTKRTPQLSFTTTSPSKALQLVNTIHVSLPVPMGDNLDKLPEPNIAVSAIWDTGATQSVITESVAKALGLIPTGQEIVNGVHGPKPANVYRVSFILPNKVIFNIVKVTSAPILGNNIHALIGMDIIAQGDFAITHRGNKTRFSFRMPTCGHIDFTDIPGSDLHPQFLNRAERRNGVKKTRRRNQKFKR